MITQTYATNRHTPNASYNPTISAGQWYKLSARFKMNTPGVLDGICQIWIDDQLVLNHNDIGYRSSTQAGIGFREMTITPVFGGTGGSSKAATDYQWYDRPMAQATPFGGTGGGDITAPYDSQWSPAKNATGVPTTNRATVLHVRDDVGVLTANGIVNVNGVNYTCASGLTCTGGGSTDVTVTRTQPTDYTPGQTVTVTVSGFADAAGNVMATDTYSYQIAADASTYSLVWSDEFDTPGCTSVSPCAVDSSKWRASTGDRFQADPVDVAYYTSRLQNVRVQDGTLVIESRAESYGGKSYTSGNVETKTKRAFQFGKLEIRALGTSVVNSIDQALWTIGDSGPCGAGGTSDQPAAGEIDILEYYPGSSSSYWDKTRIGQNFHNLDHDPILNETTVNASAWHTYFLEWDNTAISVGVDGVTKHTYTKTSGTCGDYPWQDPVYLLMTTQVGTIGGGTLNSNTALFTIDYVRYYKKGATPAAPLSITTASPLPNATVGVPYIAPNIEATGGTSPYTFSVSSGTYPPGMTLSPDGALGGTPISEGDYTFDVMATDAAAATATKTYSLRTTAAGGVVVTISGPTPIKDTYIDSTTPSVNYSTASLSHIYQYPSFTVANRALYKIDLSSLPDNILITTGYLYLYNSTYTGSGGNDRMPVHVYRATVADASTVTWANFDNTSMVDSGESFGYVALEPGWYPWRVTNIVKYGYANGKTVGIALDGGSEGASNTNRAWSTMEGAYPPYLVVTYTQLSGGLPISAPGKMRVSGFRGTLGKSP
jgi:hypothetical protein